MCIMKMLLHSHLLQLKHAIMASFSQYIFFSILLSMIAFATAEEYDRSFDQVYYPYYGLDHFKRYQDGDQDEIQLTLDQNSGSYFSKINSAFLNQEYGLNLYYCSYVYLKIYEINEFVRI